MRRRVMFTAKYGQPRRSAIEFVEIDHSGYASWHQSAWQQGLGQMKEDLIVIMDLL